MFAWGLAQRTLGMATTSVVSLVVAAVLYALATATAASLRAVLHWYATTGEVPPGLPSERLPEIGQRSSFTGAGSQAADGWPESA